MASWHSESMKIIVQVRERCIHGFVGLHSEAGVGEEMCWRENREEPGTGTRVKGLSVCSRAPRRQEAVCQLKPVLGTAAETALCPATVWAAARSLCSLIPRSLCLLPASRGVPDRCRKGASLRPRGWPASPPAATLHVPRGPPGLRLAACHGVSPKCGHSAKPEVCPPQLRGPRTSRRRRRVDGLSAHLLTGSPNPRS